MILLVKARQLGSERVKSELERWKIHFVTLKAFLKIGCGAEVRDTCSPHKKFKYPSCTKLQIISVDGLLSHLSPILLILWVKRRKRERHHLSKWRPKSSGLALECRERRYLRSLTSSMETKVLLWGMYERTSFTNKKARKCPIRQAKNHELLPDEEAVDRRPRLSFCQGLWGIRYG